MPRFASLARGAALVVLSDGLERGDPTAMARRSRASRRGLRWRIIWLTPLAADAGLRSADRRPCRRAAYLDRLGDGGSIDSICANVLDMAKEKAA